ncbi:MAG: hypothetical protein JNM17_18455 [Archangium sp.]|nr:hypothetical protein [Archangium sp.]
MNSLSTRLEAFIDDPRVRIAGPVLAIVVTVALMIFGNVATAPSAASKMKAVSVLPDQPLNLGTSTRASEAVDGAAAILAWQNLPAAKTAPSKPAAKDAKPAKGKKATLARR